MDFSLSTLIMATTLPLLTLGSKRSLVNKTTSASSSSSSDVPPNPLILVDRRWSLSKISSKFLEDDEEADDDTATTLSSSSSSSSSFKMVTFAEPLVTSVRTRPTTTREEIYDLYYNEQDYIDFKVEFLTGRGRNRKVSFVPGGVVTARQPVPETPNELKGDLFYSETELQQFLDDFVASLHQP